jgi:hypothetical protein
MAIITNSYEDQTEAAIKAVKEIFEIARFSKGVEIKISLAVDEVPTITYTIKNATINT